MAVLLHFKRIEQVSGTRELDIRLPGKRFGTVLLKEGLGEGPREQPASAGVLDSIKERLTAGKITESELAGMMQSLKMACKSPNLMQDAIKMLEDAIRLEPGGRSLIPALLGNIGTRGVTYLDEVDLHVESILKRVCSASDVGMLLCGLNWQNRLSIERIIGAVSDESSAPALREGLRSGNYLQMVCVIPAIAKIKDEESVPGLIAFLNERPLERQLRAISRERGWGENGIGIPEMIRRWDMGFRLIVIDSLGKIGDTRATLPLMDLLDYRSPDVRKGAIEALGRVGDYEKLLPAMLSSDKRRMILLRKSLEAFVDGCESLDTIQDFLVRWDRMLVENLGRRSEELKEGELDRNLARVLSRAARKEKKLRRG
ncbi:MAG: HEAT repeat domain-containing protein [Candidatus Micrarchaeota archaeon]